MKRQYLARFCLEALLLVAVFAAMVLVLTGVFGAARTQSLKAKRLTQSVTIASNAAEALYASNGLEQAAALLDANGLVRTAAGRLEADYRVDGTLCSAGEGALRLYVAQERSASDPLLEISRISVCAAGEDEPVYTLETTRFRKEARP